MSSIGRHWKVKDTSNYKKPKLWFLGKKLSLDHRKKLSLARMGKEPWNKGKHWSKEMRQKLSLVHLGYKASEETKRKMRLSAKKGEYNWKWIKDRTQLKRINKQGERRSSAYFFWRKQVWTRDGWKCKINNEDCEGRIEAHHILSWSVYPELRYEINNGITLCHAHHPKKRAEEAKFVPVFQEMISAIAN